ncbi:MAG: S-adenosylmethionine:tRNA ribosyltransferase-isomerase [Deltaproteobacteria bacterium]|nr:S-adenosylmethionine:tRNA ribosyltransferase-isomerase [Deltaproteobacteria bacterium]
MRALAMDASREVPMQPARAPRARPEDARLLHVRTDGSLVAGHSDDLTRWLAPGSVLVLNSAATLPSSLMGHTAAGQPLELRLAEAPSLESKITGIRAVLFGAGDWRVPTESRGLAPTVCVGEVLSLGPLRATVVHVDPTHARLVTVTLRNGESDELSAVLQAIYTHARPIQYAYLRDPMALWDAQTLMAERPVAVEAPSAGLLLSWGTLDALRARGVIVCTLEHATGLSSTGEAGLDARFPLDERYEITERTAAIVNAAVAEARPVVAVGTGVLRALESSHLAHGTVRAGRAIAALRLSAETPARVATALLTGMHAPGTSHASLMESLAPAAYVQNSYVAATVLGWLGHEFGDGLLLERALK